MLTATLYIDGEEISQIGTDDGRQLFEEMLVEAAEEWTKLDGFKVIVERENGIFRAIRS